MPNIIQLEQQRDAIAARAKAANEADDIETFDAAFAELDAINKRIERTRKLDEIDRRAAAVPVHGDPKLTGEIRQRFSVARAMAGAAGLNVDWGFEREVQRDLSMRMGATPQGVLIPTEVFETRTISTTAPVAGPGGKLIPTDFLDGQYINALTASTVVASMGARTLSGLTGNVEIPGESDAPTVAWVQEDNALSSSDAKFRSVTLAPKHLGSLSEFSRNMLLQPSPGVEGILRQMMARDIALEIDRAAIAGASNGPTGLLSTNGVQSQAYSSTLFKTTALMIGKADTANVDASRAFLTTSGIREVCLQALDNNNLPVPVAAIFHDEPVVFSNQAPAGIGSGSDEDALIYGDWSQMLIGIWSALDVLVNPYESTAYKKGNIMVRSMATVDVAVRHPAAFVKATAVKPTTAIALPASN